MELNGSFEHIWDEGYELHGQRHVMLVRPLKLENELDMIRKLREEEIGLLRKDGINYLVHRVGDDITYYAAAKVEPLAPF